ncbi:aquaporin [bacterium]|nr:aquaporin [bacterium]
MPRQAPVPELWRALGAEFSGAFCICFFGFLAIHNSAGQGPAGLLHVAAVFGACVALMLAAFMPLSGGHFNPAATLAALSLGHVRPLRAIAHVLAQLGGAALATAILALLLGQQLASAALTRLHVNLSLPGGFLLEMAGTALMLLVAFSLSARPGLTRWLPWAVGLAVSVNVLAIGPLTGASLNPARSFGPALLSGEWGGFWLYLLAPLSGGLLAAGLAQLLFKSGTAGVKHKRRATDKLAHQGLELAVPQGEESL